MRTAAGVTLRFEHEALPGRVVFGAGRVGEVPAEAERLGATRVVLVAAGEEDALAHRAEARWVPAANPVISALAEDGIRALAREELLGRLEPIDVGAG